MPRRRRRRKKSKAKDNGNSRKGIINGYPVYPEDVIIAVKYLMEKGITRSTEIAERLDLSPYTVRNIKKILRERGLIEGKEKVRKTVVAKAKSKKPKDVIEEILGGE